MRSLKFSTLIFSALIWVGFGASSADAATPKIVNNSFETTPAPLWPGITPIVGWVFTNGNLGINPCIVATPLDDQNQTWSTNVFSNNGRIPHGTNVAFCWGAGKLFQTITNFEAGKHYAVKFYYNSRAGFPSGTLHLSLGGQELISGLPVDPVAVPRVYDVPYHRGMAEVFSPAVSGNYDLVLENRTTVDSTLVFDQFEILELGSLRIVSAQRDTIDPTKVVVEFSMPVEPSLAADPANYSLLESGEKSRGARMLNAKTVELHTPHISRHFSMPHVKAIWITDLEGKGMMPEKAQAQVTVDPLPLVGLKIEVSNGQLVVSWPAGPQSAGLNLFRGTDFADRNMWEDLGSFFLETSGFYTYSTEVEGTYFFQLQGPGPN